MPPKLSDPLGTFPGKNGKKNVAVGDLRPIGDAITNGKRKKREKTTA